MSKDHLGSIRIVLDNSNASPVHDNYQPFGMKMTTPNTHPYQYTGQEWDDEVNLNNYRARMYDPAIGRFLSAEPMHEFATPYSYVGSSPINSIDPTGMERVHSGQSYIERNPNRYDTFAGMGPDPYTTYGGPLGSYGDPWLYQHRSVEMNAATMSRSTFNSYYGVNQMTDGQRANFAAGIGDPGYMVITDNGTYLYADKSFQTDFAGGGLENWYRAVSLGAQSGGLTMGLM